MKKGLVVISAMAVALSLSACSKSDDGKKDGGKGSVNPGEISQGKPLTDDEALVLKKAFKGIEEVPGADLFLLGDESEDQKKRIQDKVAALQGRQKEIHAEIQKNCKISGSTPKEDITGGKTGDVIDNSGSITISGENCLVNSSETTKGNIRVDFSNIQEIQEEYERTKDESVLDRMILKASINSQVKNSEVNGDKLAQETGVKSKELNTSVQGNLEFTKNGSKASFSAQGAAKAIRNDNTEVAMNLSAVMQSDGEKSNMSMRLDIRTGQVSAVLQVVSANSDKKFYLNGHEKSEAEVKEIFGEVSNMVNANEK